MVQNRRIVLNSRPPLAPSEQNFRLETAEVDLEGGTLQEGDILVKTIFVSLDPYLIAPLGRPGDEARPSQNLTPNNFKDAGAIRAIGDLFGGRCSGVVLKSKNPKVSPGDLVAADWRWEEYAIFNPDQESTYEKLERDVFTSEKEEGKLSISTALGALGVSGSHAYFGFTVPLHPKSGETMVVSSAGGNIGTVVSQFGRIHGVRTVGITGGAEKAKDLVKKNIVDAAVDYKAANGDVETLSKQLKEACPNGIDAYFDCSRGFISEAVYKNLNKGARVYICGGIARYTDGSPLVASTYGNIPQIEGVTFSAGPDLYKTYLFEIPRARAELVRWAKEGKIRFWEHVIEGFENIPKAFVAMYEGKNFGKMLVKV